MDAHRKPVTVGGLLHAVAPLVLYYLLSTLASFFFIQLLTMEAGFAVMESETGGIYDYILQEYPGRMLEIVLLTAVLAVPAFAWMYYRDLRARTGFSFRKVVVVLEVYPVMWAMLGSMCLALLLNLALLSSPLPGWSPGFDEIQYAIGQGGLWMQIAASGVAAAVTEELLMRGLLYGRMREMMSAGSAVFWSALAFGVCHGNLVQGIYGFLMGCFLGYLAERFHTVMVPIFAHMAANLFVIVISEGGGIGVLLTRPWLLVVMMLVCTLSVALSLFLIWITGSSDRQKTEPEND